MASNDVLQEIRNMLQGICKRLDRLELQYKQRLQFSAQLLLHARVVAPRQNNPAPIQRQPQAHIAATPAAVDSFNDDSDLLQQPHQNNRLLPIQNQKQIHIPLAEDVLEEENLQNDDSKLEDENLQSDESPHLENSTQIIAHKSPLVDHEEIDFIFPPLTKFENPTTIFLQNFIQVPHMMNFQEQQSFIFQERRTNSRSSLNQVGENDEELIHLYGKIIMIFDPGICIISFLNSNYDTNI